MCSYPALYLSHFKPVSILKGKLFTYLLARKAGLRKGSVRVFSIYYHFGCVNCLSDGLSISVAELIQTEANLGYGSARNPLFHDGN